MTNTNGTIYHADIDDLPMLEALRQQFQRDRIRMTNRVTAVEDGRSERESAAVEHFSTRFQALEDEVTGMIAVTIRDHELWPWMQAVKGIGPGLAGAMLAPIDIERATTISALWKYAGQGVTNGERDRRRKGEKLSYNAGLKKTCYLVATSFMRSGSPYRREYDEAKVYYERQRLDWTPGHRDMAAKRKMVKLFLSHLWTVWRVERDLPLRTPYAYGVLDHDPADVKPPWAYVPNYEYPHALREQYEAVSTE